MLIFIKQKTNNKQGKKKHSSIFSWNSSSSSSSIDDGSLLIHLEREYNLKIREQFHLIENHISEYLREKRDNYEQIAQRLK